MDRSFCCAFSFSLLLVFQSGFILSEATNAIGINYGLLGNNLPAPPAVVGLIKSRNITRVRLFEPRADVLSALTNSGIEVVLGTLNQDLQRLATDPAFATQWVQTNVVPYAGTLAFKYISAGNEVIPGDLAIHVPQAIVNLDAAVKATIYKIPITTAVPTSVLGNSYPPSAGEFSAAVAPVIGPIVAFLEQNQYPLLVNVYPYFTYINNLKDIHLDYALFQSPNVVVQDGPLGYMNLFDAVVDSVYSALEKAGGPNVEIIVTESGWPSAQNGDIATVENARIYNQNLVVHACTSGTPKRPYRNIQTYVFAMFNENQKPVGTEQNFGLYQPDQSEVYHIDFSTCQN
ncbi:hypothetical protein Sjap_004202 [Stephania japonica]|uniref:Uncharacterized protein n=1 Tax=Stephania japonica TaxID=461633 RepID=A0AAP0K2R4_9MAGN